MHKVILYVLSNGISKDYPISINFQQIPFRINGFKEELVSIINNVTTSYYCDLTNTIYEDIGYHKAKAPMILMNRCENFQVKI